MRQHKYKKESSDQKIVDDSSHIYVKNIKTPISVFIHIFYILQYYHQYHQT